jgi:superfamily II DNA or RNA helicase
MVRLSLGPVRYTIAASTLISSGWLSIPNITVVQLDDQRRIEQLMEQNETTKDPDEKITYDNEIAFLNSDKLRWSWIASFIVEKGSAQKGNVLCLVSSVIVGKRLAKLIPNSTFLYGKDKQEVRQRVYDLFETNDDLIVIATVQIAGVGLSIDRIFNLCYVDGGKSFVRTIQTIGRGLRKGKDKDSVDIIDICGNLKYSKDHLTKRIKYYKGAHYKYKKLLVEYSENVEIIR